MYIKLYLCFIDYFNIEELMAYIKEWVCLWSIGKVMRLKYLIMENLYNYLNYRVKSKNDLVRYIMLI